MYSLPHANATITKVTKSGGAGDGWDAAAAGTEARWEGQADAYVRDTRRRETNGERIDYVDVRRVSLPEGVPVQTEDTLTIEYRGEVLTVPVLNLVVSEAPPGVPGGSVVEVEPS